MKTITRVMTALMGVLLSGCSYEAAFERTRSGEVEIKTIPAATTLTAAAEGDYFNNADQLFMPLFNYIKKNEVAMTVPVVGDMDRGRMQFYVGKKDAQKLLASTRRVKVEQSRPVTVVSMGGKGSYSRKNLSETERRLGAWLSKQDQFSPVGKPYAVFWNSPFVPDGMKRYEIHVPVERSGTED